MDCYVCGKEIGSLDDPIFVLPNNETIVCRECHFKEVGQWPASNSAQFDSHLVSGDVSDEYFKNLED